jgi:hypothetical protein
MTCETSLMGASNTRDSSGSMGSQMRCSAMLEKVASDNKKIARRVVGERACEVGVWFFKAWTL